MKYWEFVLGDRTIGAGGPVLVIADVGLGHGGDVARICDLIDAAAESGADAVGIHAHNTERLIAADEVGRDPAGQEAWRRLRSSELTAESHSKLKAHADSRGTTYIPMPFDENTVDILDQLGVSAYRVSSCDLTHIPLLRHIGTKGKPVFLSTGMSYLSEVADAVWALRSGGAAEIVLMHCVSSHPAPAESLNLNAIRTLRDHFELPVGYSDCSEGALFPLAAVTLGAVAVEKALILRKNAEDPAYPAAIEPAEMLALVRCLRALEISLGDGRKRPAPCEDANRIRERRSIVAACDIRAYESLSPWMLACKRPGGGIEPGRIDRLIGMRARRNISKDAVLRWDDLAAGAGREQDGARGLVEGSYTSTGARRPGHEASTHGGADIRAGKVGAQSGGR